MTKQGETALWLAGAGIAWLLFGKARAAGTLIFLPGRVLSVGYDNGAATVKIELIVQNTSSGGITLESIAGNLYSGDTYIGNASSFVPQQILQNSQSSLVINIRLGLLGLVQDIFTAFNSGAFVRIIRFSGFANAGFVRVPVNVEFNVGAGANRN